MNEQELILRTKKFALRIMKLVSALPNTKIGNTISGQLVRSGVSVGSNYRAACRGRSKAEFIAKLGIVVEEADECAYLLDLMIDGEVMKKERVTALLNEANEILAIMVASRKSAQSRLSIENRKSKIENAN